MGTHTFVFLKTDVFIVSRGRSIKTLNSERAAARLLQYRQWPRWRRFTISRNAILDHRCRVFIIIRIAGRCNDMEHPTFRRAPNGTILLKASPEAQALPRQCPRAQAPYRAKKPEEVDSEAWAHVVSEGGDTSNAALVLCRWKVQFGRYQGRTFHWLLENDVGYSVNLVASHQKERERTEAQSPLMANKGAFARYSSAYPDFVDAVRFHRAFEEARAISLQPGQEGRALVGFGDFKFETLQGLYDSTDNQKVRFVKYLQRISPAPGTQMENAVQYVRSRDRRRTNAAADASTSSSCSAASPSAASQRATSASQPLGSALTAFVSGRRSLSAVEMQAQVKKLVAPRPASTAAHFSPFRPALSSPRSSVEPTDEELVKAVVDLETSFPRTRGEQITGKFWVKDERCDV
ncbi:uncharacterized protein AB9W97_011833 isoform 2-T2 [Spinachia spinachia]